MLEIVSWFMQGLLEIVPVTKPRPGDKFPFGTFGFVISLLNSFRTVRSAPLQGPLDQACLSVLYIFVCPLMVSYSLQVCRSVSFCFCLSAVWV